jgi:uroporphyrinogen III methyltransferase/synthase
MIHQTGLKPPATIIVGEVVRLREKLDWYERLPLFGLRIVVTRAKDQAEVLTAKLRALGAVTVELPTIAIEPALDSEPLDCAIARLEEYDWLIFTSANGVHFFLERLDRSTVDLRKLRARLGAIGPATRRALESLHLKVDLMGREYVAESLVSAFREFDMDGKRVLLPRAAVARDLLPQELRRRGAQVDVVEAYRTVIPPDAPALAQEVFAALPRPDWITFTSSSTVKNLLRVISPNELEHVKIASIGPVTSASVRQSGLEVTVEAADYTTDGLIQAVVNRAADTWPRRNGPASDRSNSEP